MHLYQVGKPYTTRTSWPELAQYNYRGGEHELVIFLANPDQTEIGSIRRGTARFGLYTYPGDPMLIVLTWRFEPGVPWSDAPYSIHLVPPEQRTLPPEAAGPALLHIVLVDAATGIIKALRMVSLPADFTQALHAAIREQAERLFTRATYNGRLESLYESYTSAELAAMAGISCVIGEVG